jgi:lycopene beta-cyclase
MLQRPVQSPRSHDVLLVGGGLANGLIALELRRRRPELRIGLLDPDVEPEPHTWCLFATDASPAAWQSLAPLLDQVWEGYDVAFPGHRRELTTAYGRLTSGALLAAVREALGPGLLRRRARLVSPEEVVCEDGDTYAAPLILDGRGASPSPHVDIRFQKFLGLELQLKRIHGLRRPIVMDATVRQTDGYRFVYALPLAADRVLVEDTRYSDAETFDRLQLESEMLRYARGAGWSVGEVVRRERGALPVVLSGDVEAYWDEPGRHVPQVGMRGLFFHPVTGYSFPDALQVAALVADNAHLGSRELARRLRERSIALWRQRSFYRLLNRMLFLAASPEDRYRVLERFYRLPQPLIERFYAGRTTFGDKARVLAGKPPVPVGRAFRAAVTKRASVHA